MAQMDGVVDVFPAKTRIARIDLNITHGVGITTGTVPIQTDPVLHVSYSVNGGVDWSDPTLRPLRPDGPAALASRPCAIAASRARKPFTSAAPSPIPSILRSCPATWRRPDGDQAAAPAVAGRACSSCRTGGSTRSGTSGSRASRHACARRASRNWATSPQRLAERRHHPVGQRNAALGSQHLRGIGACREAQGQKFSTTGAMCNSIITANLFGVDRSRCTMAKSG